MVTRVSRRRKKVPQGVFEITIDSFSHDGRGVGRIDNKAVFVHGALPGEIVAFTYERGCRRYDEGRLHHVLHPSPHRVEPFCPHFDLCGGCALQHMEPGAQLAYKEQTLLDALQRLGKVMPQRILPRLSGLDRGYRGKARLGVRYVIKKERILVGFREKRSSFLADIATCPVLHPAVGDLLEPLSALVRGLSVYRSVPQIEAAVGDEGPALVFRHLEPLLPQDLAALGRFATEKNVRIFLQPGGEDSVSLLGAGPAELSYTHPAFGCTLFFRPTDFIQVNGRLNRALVERAVDLLAPGCHDRVLDLFCGIGNFTLPLATRAGQVVGVEGDAALVARARTNAEKNALTNTDFHVADLFAPDDNALWAQGKFDLVLVDPPRSGAMEVLPVLAATGAGRIVYVSCNPATLARDAGHLVHDHGFTLAAAGVADMFPHTAHVESIALFEKTVGFRM